MGLDPSYGGTRPNGFGEAEDIEPGTPTIWGHVRTRVRGNPSNVYGGTPMEISARLSHQKLDHSKENTPHLVVSLKAPTLDWVNKRPSLCVVPVVDLSGSMNGRKLEAAKESLTKLVDQLQPGDIAGLVGFESRAHVLVAPAEVTSAFKQKLKSEIRKLRVMGGTDLWGGISQAVTLIQGLDLAPKYLKRAIIFTDGQPTEGAVTDQSQIVKMVSQTRGSVTISAFGYGDVGGGVWNGCDQEFLTNLSQEGAGNYAYVKGPDDALTAFARELGGLLSTYAQDIRVEIEPAAGHRVTKAITDIAIEQDPLGEIEFKISDILSEETRHFVFEAKTQKQDKLFPRPLNFFTVSVSYSVFNEQGKKETFTAETKVKAQFVETGEEQVDADKDLEEIIGMAQVVRAQLEAEVLAKRGDYNSAVQVMGAVSANLDNKSLGHLAGIAKSVQKKLTDAVTYSSSQGYLRSTARGGTRSYGLSGMDAEAQHDLLQANVAFSNSSMDAMELAFQSHGPVVAPVPESVIQGPVPAVKIAPVIDSLTSGYIPPDMVIAIGDPQSLFEPIPLDQLQGLVTPDKSVK